MQELIKSLSDFIDDIDNGFTDGKALSKIKLGRGDHMIFEGGKDSNCSEVGGPFGLKNNGVWM